ncbi:G-protein coupled receptor family C group 6 member A-like [Rhinophrynus dorsalis]
MGTRGQEVGGDEDSNRDTSFSEKKVNKLRSLKSQYDCHLHSINVCKTPNDRIARLHGDIMIGGLFPIHNEIPNLGNYTKPQDLICTGFEMRGFLRSLGMIHAIERINNLNLLPGITLGYEIYDTCADASKGVEEAMRFIGKRDSSTGNIEVNCNYTSYSPTVKAVIGAGYSEVSIAVSRLLSFQLIPQISYSSSASILSDKRRFPSFLRTVPSDMHLTKALAMLISKFKWTYVGIISSDDEYGLSVMESLSVNFDLQLVCAAFKEKIPADFGNPQVKKAIKNVIGTIKQSPVTVVILALKVPIVMELFMEIIKQNISRIWIATDNWSTSREVAALKDIQSVGNILGFSFKNGEIPGFRNYLRTLHLERNTTNAFIEEYKHLRFDCSEEYKDYERCLHSSVDNCIKSDSLKLKSSLACSIKNVSLASDDFLERNIELDGSYSAYLAVTAIAKSIKNMLCSNRICNTNTTFLPWQLLQEVKKIRFYDYDEDVFFNKKGDANIGYDLLSWYTVNESMQFHVVGRYEPDNISIHVNSSQIVWNTPNNKVPDSKCSKSCAPGQYKIHSTIRCCYNCSQCAEGYYSRDYDMNQCTKCPFGQWSNNGSSHCENQTIEYFQWSDPFAILLCSFSFIGFLLVLIMGIVFFKYVTTPAVKAAGGIYICVMNMSLLISFASTGFFIGEPSQFSCKIRQPMYGISFTLCVSCILIKSFRIVLAFELGKRVKNNVKLTYQPFLVVIALTCFQVGVCIIWLAIKSPDVRAINIIPQKLILQCDEGSNLGYGIMLGYIGFLAFVCFALAYKGRNLPDIYNECRLITFSMLIYLFVWFAFIPVYLTTTGKYLSAVEIVAILASNYGVICCHLIPTCYIIFFKKNINRRETYLQRKSALKKSNNIFAFYARWQKWNLGV